MAKEIERKFLINPHVDPSLWKTDSPIVIRQGYLSANQVRTVRVRVGGDRAFLTVKSLTQGFTRDEFEYEVPLDDGLAMLELCEKPLIEKHRYVIEHEGFTWEVDEFFGANAGLFVAEIELESEAQSFPQPDWAGTEVTDDPRYYNANLARKPVSEWE